MGIKGRELPQTAWGKTQAEKHTRLTGNTKDISSHMALTLKAEDAIRTCLVSIRKMRLESHTIPVTRDNDFQDENCLDVKRGELPSVFCLKNLTFTILPEPSKTC